MAWNALIKETATAEIEAPAERIWSFISDFGGLMRWHPELVRVTSEPGPKGPVRVNHFPDWSISETLDLLDSRNHVLEYSVLETDRPELAGAKAQMKLTPLGPERTRIDWTTGFDDEQPGRRETLAGVTANRSLRVRHLKAALGISND